MMRKAWWKLHACEEAMGRQHLQLQKKMLHSAKLTWTPVYRDCLGSSMDLHGRTKVVACTQHGSSMWWLHSQKQP